MLSSVQLFVTPWTAACQAPLSSTVTWSLLQLVSIELVMLSNHLILFSLGGPDIGALASASVLPMNIQGFQLYWNFVQCCIWLRAFHQSRGFWPPSFTIWDCDERFGQPPQIHTYFVYSLRAYCRPLDWMVKLEVSVQGAISVSMLLISSLSL